MLFPGLFKAAGPCPAVLQPCEFNDVLQSQINYQALQRLGYDNPTMTWLSMVGTVLYYLSRPITTTFNWILVILAPIIHLVHYITWACLLPLKLVTKFEVSSKIPLTHKADSFHRPSTYSWVLQRSLVSLLVLSFIFPQPFLRRSSI